MNKYQTNWLVSLIFTLLFLAVHFIPDLGGADVMGAQWLYSSIVDLLAVLYILFNRGIYKDAIDNVIQYKFSIVFSVLLLWAMGSYFYAINPTESLVTLARLVTTYFIFINLSILYYKQDLKKIFNVIAVIVSFILLYDAIYVISGFSNNMETMGLDQNILSLSGNHGNKNVMAASLLIKFPFVLWVILNNKVFGKLLGLICLFLGIFALFILNTRSTFVGLLLILSIFTITTIFYKYKTGKKEMFIQIAFFLIPIIVAYFSANLILSNAIEMQGFQGGYGTVTKRVGDINIASEQNSRIHLWKAAADYAFKHPLFGAGYGNWKLASIPYEKERATDLFVPYHSHNDFIEMFADLGVIGGTSFLILFLLLFLFAIKIWRKEEAKDFRLLATISLMAITCYFVDAFLNFPAERTAMQTMLAMSAALIFAPAVFLSNKQSAKVEKKASYFNLLYFIFAFSTLIPSIDIAYQTYQSLKVQKFVMGEIDADPKMPLDEVKDAFPHFPNLSTSTLPIKALIARYYFRDKQNERALELLKESDKDNPYLHYNDFIRTAIYASKNDFDSTFYYAKRAFDNWPRAASYYKNMMFAAAKKKDTATINSAFALYRGYRNEATAYDQYLLAMYEVQGGATAKMKILLDSATKAFPNDSLAFLKVRSIFYSNGAVVNNPGTNNFLLAGIKAFQKGDFIAAAEMYKKAATIEPSNYTHFENSGICFYSNRDFKKAIPYFKNAIQIAGSKSGKSFYFMGLSYIQTGDKTNGCKFLKNAMDMNYADANNSIQQNCK